jgi:hypothetical protein
MSIFTIIYTVPAIRLPVVIDKTHIPLLVTEGHLIVLRIIYGSVIVYLLAILLGSFQDLERLFH